MFAGASLGKAIRAAFCRAIPQKSSKLTQCDRRILVSRNPTAMIPALKKLRIGHATMSAPCIIPQE